MKCIKLSIFALLFTIVANAQDAQSLSLNIYGGYTFRDRLEYQGSHAYVDECFQYGGGLEYFFADDVSLELKYLRVDTSMPLYGPGGTQLNAGNDDGAINYILLGGTRYFDVSPSIAPYLGAGMGVGIVETPQNGSGTYFAWDIKVGMKIKTPSVVSVNINAYLQSVSSAIGNTYYYGYYGGYVDYVSAYQFGLGAVLSFNFQ